MYLPSTFLFLKLNPLVRKCHSDQKVLVTTRLPHCITSILLGNRTMRILGSSRITGKSQVTIPKAVREKVNLEKGDLVVFVGEKDQVVIKRGLVKVEI